ncbi:MAG: hypothetical protein KKE44_19200 [Proteobacteria bacterium]|nr:hypothetical protein [Pseudomonadota bacterium]MBU1584861.1 hypothetical protein [Pseudomonadota bacterium]MBU2456102.1 hypothetical protein [Pseudomonadota bacterium]MBU2628765.1 hypothetical protein [Pseudomonadota bacterium]
MIDIHCHILPGLDDGPKNLEQAVEMAVLAKQSGISKIIATPHFLNMVYAVDFKAVYTGATVLSRELKKQKISLEIFSGAEIRIAHNTGLLLKKGLLPSLANSKYYLFELPDIFIKDGILRVLQQLREQEIFPIIAHPERNHTIMKNPGVINDFGNEKALFQVTGDSVLGKNGKLCQKITKDMIQLGQVQFIGSDGHDIEFRKPSLENVYKAVKKISDEKTARKILIENPEMILDQASGGKHMGKRVG